MKVYFTYLVGRKRWGNLDDENNLDNELIETIGLILFMLIYALAGTYIFPLLLFLFPAPFIYIGVKKQAKMAIIGITLVSLLIGLIVDPYSGIILFELFMPLTLVIIYEIKNRRSTSEIIIYGTIVFFISCLLLYGLAQDVSGSSIISQLEEGVNEMVNAQIGIFEESGLSNYEILRTRDQLQNAYSFMVSIFPIILIIISIFMTYINYYASAAALKHSGIEVVYVSSFSQFQLPRNIFPSLIIIFILLLGLSNFDLPKFDVIVLNIAVFTWFMFNIQGLSVIDFFMIKHNFRLVSRFIIMSLIVFILPVAGLPSFVGFLDAIFDFRKLKELRS